MHTLESIQAKLREEMPYLRERYHVETLGVFGSYVRGEQTEASDLDLFVTFFKTPDLLTFVDLDDYLEARLACRVDLVTPNALKRRRRLAPYVLQEVQPL